MKHKDPFLVDQSLLVLLLTSVVFLAVVLLILSFSSTQTVQQQVEAQTIHEAQTGGYSFQKPDSAHCYRAGNGQGGNDVWQCNLYSGATEVATASTTGQGAVFAPPGFVFPHV